MSGPSYALLKQELSQSLSAYVSAVDAALVALGAIGIQTAFLTRREDYGGGRRPRLELTLSYSSPGPLSFRAAMFGGGAGSDPDAEAATFFAAHPGVRLHFIRDIGDQRRAHLDSNAVMIIYATNVLSNCGQDRQRVVIVQAVADIAAGASGSAQMVSSTGLVAGGVITVVNRFDSTWVGGTRGYAAVRPGTCIWDGYPTCC